MMFLFILLGFYFEYVFSIQSTINPFFRNWHCIGIKSKCDFTKPYVTNIGELPLVVWKNSETKSLISMLNICKHMGSKLDKATITCNGALKCPYHGLEFNEKDGFGKIIEWQNKIFWSYDPFYKLPNTVPFVNNKNYENQIVTIDMPGSLQDVAYNVMDLLHPEYVHNNIFGFGSTVPPTNVKQHLYPTAENMVGLSFDYASRSIAVNLNDASSIISTDKSRKLKQTKNYNAFVYPNFGWSRVTVKENNLIIGVHLQPLDIMKTRMYVTVCHNYYKSDIQKKVIEIMTMSILGQDFVQLKQQYIENDLKKSLLFLNTFKQEESLRTLHSIFKEKFKYPDMDSCLKLVEDWKTRNKNT